MKLSLTLVALAIALLYGIVVHFFPDFPISQDVVTAFILYVLAKLGIEVVEPLVRRGLVKAGFTGFIEAE